MTRPPGLDPEVLADLRLREASERDPSRSRESTQAFGDATIVEHWPCRAGCNTMVGVTRSAIDAFETLNAQLARRNQPPILKRAVMWCPDCKRRDDDLRVMEREARRPMKQTELGVGPAEHRRTR